MSEFLIHQEEINKEEEERVCFEITMNVPTLRLIDYWLINEVATRLARVSVCVRVCVCSCVFPGCVIAMLPSALKKKYF